MLIIPKDVQTREELEKELKDLAHKFAIASADLKECRECLRLKNEYLKKALEV